jgi:hypothetical protein
VRWLGGGKGGGEEERGGPRGSTGSRGKEGGSRPISLFYLFLFLFLVLSYFLHDVKSNSLLNPCSTKSLIKQSESML